LGCLGKRLFKNRRLSAVSHSRLKRPPDDYEAMREVVSRRFKRGLQEQESAVTKGVNLPPSPKQCSSTGVKASWGPLWKSRRNWALKMPFLALAEKREEIYLAGRSQPVLLSRDAPGLLLLRQIRDEAHRFALSLPPQFTPERRPPLPFG